MVNGTITVRPNKCPMNMIFHFNHCERILWSWWVASEVVEFLFSCLALCALSFALEAVKYWREVLIKQEARRRALKRRKQIINDAESNQNNTETTIASTSNGTSSTTITTVITNGQQQCCSNGTVQQQEQQQQTYWQRICNSMHVTQMLLYTLQMSIAYIIMLAFMNFNYWMCLAMIAGLALGYFCFGWIKQRN